MKFKKKYNDYVIIFIYYIFFYENMVWSFEKYMELICEKIFKMFDNIKIILKVICKELYV